MHPWCSMRYTTRKRKDPRPDSARMAGAEGFYMCSLEA